MAVDAKPMPAGQLVLFARFIIIAVLVSVCGYILLCSRWPLQEPIMGSRDQLITALDWHTETARTLFSRDSRPELFRAVGLMYLQEFGWSGLWWVAVNACIALGFLAAFSYDSRVMMRRNEFSRVSRQSILLGVALWFTASALATAVIVTITRHSGETPALAVLPAQIALSAFALAPVGFIVRRALRLGRPGEGMTDVRHAIEKLKKLVGGRPYDPARYFDLAQGIFMGLSDGKPVYVPLRSFRATHCEVLGETGTGKTVQAANIIAQCARAGESCWVFDPKEPDGDEHMKAVLYRQAQAAGVPMYLLNLNPANGPQLNLLQGAQSHEVAELLINGFDLEKQGNNADVWKNVDQIVAEDIAQFADKKELSFPFIADAYAGELVAAREADERKHPQGWNFWLELGKFLRVRPFLCRRGLDLKALTERPCIVYVIGSTRNVSVIAGQKMLLFRVMQLIAQRDRSKGQYSCIFLDEFRYLLSPQALTMLSTIRDKHCHVILAHQSLKDLRNCGNLDPDAVHGAVVTNTGYKVVYRSKDPQTAEFFAKMSGTIGAVAGTANIDVTGDGNRGAWREVPRAHIEENFLMNLPSGAAGSGLAVIFTPSDETRFIYVSALPKGENPPLYEPPPEASAPAAAPSSDGSLPKLASAVGTQTNVPAEPTAPQPTTQPEDEDVL